MISSKFLSKIDVLFRVSLIPLLLFHFYLEIHTKLAAPAILGLHNFFWVNIDQGFTTLHYSSNVIVPRQHSSA